MGGILKRGVLAVCLILVFVMACGSGSNTSQPGTATQPSVQTQIRIVQDTPLPGDASRFDYESLDPQAHRLYIAHLGAGSVLVYDIQQNKLVATIPGIPGVHGVLAIPELGRVYASATDARQIAVIDTSSLSVVATAQGDGYPDGLAYAPDAGKVYVSDEQDGNETVVDVRTNQRIGAVPVGGEAGNTQYDPASHHIYVAVQTKNQVVVIDPTTDQVIERHDTLGCDHPHGLLIDADQHLAFVACQSNNKLLVMNMPSMQAISTLEVGQNPDVLALDPTLHQLYVAAESGPLCSVPRRFERSYPDRLRIRGPNAHVVAVAPDTHSVYLPLANLNGHPVLRGSWLTCRLVNDLLR